MTEEKDRQAKSFESKKPEEGKIRRFIKVTYRDVSDAIRETTLEFDEEDYYSSMTYRENVQMAVADIWESGGFWLDEGTIIPCSRILMYKAVPEEASKPKPKPKASPSKRRRPRRAKTQTGSKGDE